MLPIIDSIIIYILLSTSITSFSKGSLFDFDVFVLVRVDLNVARLEYSSSVDRIEPLTD